MITNHVYHALEQVKELQHKILERQRFKGYSGRARAITGTVAFLATLLMSSEHYPSSVKAHLLGWGVLFLFGFFLNYGALFHWFLFDPWVKRDIRRLKPALDALPVLFAGAVFTLVLINHQEFDLLFGTWMILFGLANLASKHVLPRKIWLVGLFYIFCGSVYLLLPGLSFTTPWPLGLVFFVGEWMGGFVLHFDGTAEFSLNNVVNLFLNVKETPHAQ